MATERLSMRKTREILRQKWELGRTHREVAASVGLSLGAVALTLGHAAGVGLDWAAAQALSDPELEERLYGPRDEGASRPMPDCEYLHAERKKPGVTLELFHLEYLKKHPNGYRYTQFCERYREWLKRRGLTMRQEHCAGEKLFVDYAGKKPHRRRSEDRRSDRLRALRRRARRVQLHLRRGDPHAARAGRRREPRARARRAGGVPAALVPGQLKSGVVAACRYEPGIQRTYEDLAQHYGTAVLPARPHRPRDKAKVEVAVQIAERWIDARLRHETFFSFGALNERIAELLLDLNGRMRVYGASRRELFERIDRPALKPLPAEPFAYSEWKTARLNIDCHAEIDCHYYSAPHALVHEQIEARLTAVTVELFHRGERVASHVRSYRRGGHTTVAEHMPKAHQKHLEWTPSRIVDWAGSIGPKTRELAEAILAERRHPEQGYRSCLGILRLGKRYGEERLEAACARAVAVRARSYRHVESILKNGLDQLPSPAEEKEEGARRAGHENIPGGGYYH